MSIKQNQQNHADDLLDRINGCMPIDRVIECIENWTEKKKGVINARMVFTLKEDVEETHDNTPLLGDLYDTIQKPAEIL